ncbi:plasmid maintenance system antidote protein VapI [Curtobacterium flaccumfaciens]|uniref:Plasmid maintenance system antidote protein VapI n=1 Tax=Curtobacterium salicis TaxID=1779862 RepID=A0ABX0T9H3_9MICO|nr:hypothetical protein [Curtobacterium sp. WW7]NII42142.1 plasmid maintenance system antidote protein VapI [Curtobacterium sp. WW7]
MTEQHDDLTFVEQIEADPRGRAELAVAEAQLRIEELLQEAVDGLDNINHSAVAEALGVPVDRVVRVLEGDDPLRFESFIRYLSVLGRSARISLTAASATTLPSPPGILAIDHFEQIGASSHGVSTIEWDRRVTDFEVEAIEPPRYTGTSWSLEGMRHSGEPRASRFINTYRLGEAAKGKHVGTSSRKAEILG